MIKSFSFILSLFFYLVHTKFYFQISFLHTHSVLSSLFMNDIITITMPFHFISFERSHARIISKYKVTKAVSKKI